MTWGLLGPEKIEGTRRARTLGVAAAVRAFNDLAVPGLGGVWFGKQLVLATLGVLLAELSKDKRISNITMANAVEALACGLALQRARDGDGGGNGDQRQDPRLRGTTKLRGKTDFSFSVVRKPGFYVTQPMRMATVQTLPALGLVKAETARFNAYSCTEQGEALVEAALGKKLINALNQWISGAGRADGNDLRKGVSPLQPLPEDAKQLILAQLRQGSPQEGASDKARRRAALAWVQSLRNGEIAYPGWDIKPPELGEDHWVDLQVGALFFSTRDAAIALLDTVEAHIARQTVRTLCLADPVPEHIARQIDQLRTEANAYLAHYHPQKEAKAFCSECKEGDNARVLTKLVGRDGRVLQLRNGCVVPGPAFKGRSEEVQHPDTDVHAGLTTESNTSAGLQTSLWPAGISGRVRNLFLLNADLHGDIAPWASNQPVPEGYEA